jgi:hypothetical protein
MSNVGSRDRADKIKRMLEIYGLRGRYLDYDNASYSTFFDTRGPNCQFQDDLEAAYEEAARLHFTGQSTAALDLLLPILTRTQSEDVIDLGLAVMVATGREAEVAPDPRPANPRQLLSRPPPIETPGLQPRRRQRPGELPVPPQHGLRQ